MIFKYWNQYFPMLRGTLNNLTIYYELWTMLYWISKTKTKWQHWSTSMIEKMIQKSLFSWDPIYTQKYDHMNSKKIIDTHKHLDISTMFRIPTDINIHYQKNILTKPSYRGR